MSDRLQCQSTLETLPTKAFGTPLKANSRRRFGVLRRYAVLAALFTAIPLSSLVSASPQDLRIGCPDDDIPCMVVTGQRTVYSNEAIHAIRQAELRRMQEQMLMAELERQRKMKAPEDDDNGQAVCEFLVEAGFAVAGIYVSGPAYAAIKAAAAANTALKGAKVAKVIVDVNNKVRVFMDNVPASMRALGAVAGIVLERVYSGLRDSAHGY